MGVFEELSSMNVNDHVEKKNGLSYLTWSWAWDATKRKHPDASYTIWKSENGLPYVYDELTGYMVYTSVTIDGITHEMWLPVMDGANKAMKSTPYTYKVKDWKTKTYVEKTVESATMFDINKTIMRCLVKNLAMFGLGLYIYAGEDLPQTEDTEVQPVKLTAVEEAELKAKVIGYVNKVSMSKENIERLCRCYKVNTLSELSAESCRDYLSKLGEKANE